MGAGGRRVALTPFAVFTPPSPQVPAGSGGGGVMAELTALESLIEMGFPKGRA